MTEIVKTPFRYPGSKSSFTKVIKDLIIYNGLEGKKLVEPYAGSAAVTLALLSEKVCSEAVISERDPLMYSFWKVAFEHPDKLIKKIKNVTVSLKTWHELQPLLKCEEPSEEDEVQLAFAALFFNRTNFSGVLHSGPIGGQKQSSAYSIDCRFNKEDLIDKIKRLSDLADRVEVRYGDALDVITEYKRRTTSLFYVDPPYFIQGRKLYRHHYKLKDHVALSSSLKSAKFNWILSYDSHDVIKGLYADHNHVHKAFQYSTKAPKKEDELLITTLEIPVN
ncbi:DNA adenine methylase [Noviherbaspirillum denitrificans]|uniref:site-specific DNA-methyltransferase (adenine-specific) n=1 Tax=Noviherbaspirillum denitrificans TaxID=1968433 RepID=A0A254T715_9BURK|nr:DNA adenine methylase [Noviherbaspirillum denitrificans]OWW18436.1 hypothetical protein AYR66_01145 [Noviherbaspirillum denitrificans]OWW19400.1 hypothetical protein AYR66_07630 [Noviherbaspirillum denitrificans]